MAPSASGIPLFGFIDNRATTVPWTAVIVVGIVFITKIVLRSKASLRTIPGPPSSSWALGHVRELSTAPVGELEFRWEREYGHTYRLHGGFGTNTLVTSDPKALQFIFQTSGYNFVRPSWRLERFNKMVGKSILSDEDDEHRRQRKALLAGFGFPETKALTEIFQMKGEKLAQKWKTQVFASCDAVEMNVHPWLTSATLDSIGGAAFDYQFGALEDQDSAINKAYRNMQLDSDAYPSYVQVVWTNFLSLLPGRLMRLNSFPTTGNKRLWQTRDMSQKVASKLLDEKWSVVDPSTEKRDVMSLLVKSNAGENAKSKLTRQEVIGQMGAIMFAGNETTAATLSWGLWELAKDKVLQSRVREEIVEFSSTFPDRIPAAEFENMKYTLAFINEVLRFHPIVPRMYRKAAKDVIVPLFEPIQDVNGTLLHEVVVKKGTKVYGNVASYNRRPDIWGWDPHVFRPERWFELEAPKVKFGVTGNMGGFGAGVHACIGWRFAMYQLQAFLVELLLNFEFELPVNPPEIRRTYASIMVPQIQKDPKNVRMPLRVKLLKAQL